MKLTLSWLKDHLETDATLDEIVERLTSIGLEVEHVDDKAALRPFVIAKVLTAQKHPDADKLQVLSVDTGSGDPVQVVCGAPNARAGLIGAFAAPGTYVPGIDVTLGVGKIRGVESRGMMCSERELELSDEHNGIIDLPQDAPVGTSFAAWAKLDDPVIDINLTPNRPDATSVYGIARDLAASGIGLKHRLHPPEALIEHVAGQAAEDVFLVGVAEIEGRTRHAGDTGDVVHRCLAEPVDPEGFESGRENQFFAASRRSGARYGFTHPTHANP